MNGECAGALVSGECEMINKREEGRRGGRREKKGQRGGEGRAARRRERMRITDSRRRVILDPDRTTGCMTARVVSHAGGDLGRRRSLEVFRSFHLSKPHISPGLSVSFIIGHLRWREGNIRMSEASSS